MNKNPLVISRSIVFADNIFIQRVGVALGKYFKFSLRGRLQMVTSKSLWSINYSQDYCSIFLEFPTVRESLRARDVPYLDMNSKYLCNVVINQNYQIAGSETQNVREIVWTVWLKGYRTIVYCPVVLRGSPEALHSLQVIQLSLQGLSQSILQILRLTISGLLQVHKLLDVVNPDRAVDIL